MSVKLRRPNPALAVSVCGAGVAKAHADVPLSDLTTLSHEWPVDRVAGNRAPTIHIAVTGLTDDSKSASGFSNLVDSPGINRITPSPAVVYQSDPFSAGAEWYSSAEASIDGAGGQNDPQSLSAFVASNPNAVIVQISLDNGGSSNAGGAFDALLIGLNDSDTRYDFGG